MNKLILLLVIAALTSCKTVEVRQSWAPVTHRVNGDRLTCALYECRKGHNGVYESQFTKDLFVEWSLLPGTYDFSEQAIDCDGLPSGFNNPVKVKITIP